MSCKLLAQWSTTAPTSLSVIFLSCFETFLTRCIKIFVQSRIFEKSETLKKSNKFRKILLLRKITKEKETESFFIGIDYSIAPREPRIDSTKPWLTKKPLFVEPMTLVATLARDSCDPDCAYLGRILLWKPS